MLSSRFLKLKPYLYLNKNHIVSIARYTKEQSSFYQNHLLHIQINELYYYIQISSTNSGYNKEYYIPQSDKEVYDNITELLNDNR